MAATKTSGSHIFNQPIRMNKMNLLLFLLLLIAVSCSDNNTNPIISKPKVEVKWDISPKDISFPSSGGANSIIVDANGEWKAESKQSWCKITPSIGYNGQTKLEINTESNHLTVARIAEIVFTSGEYSHIYKVTQQASVIGDYVPSGYTKVWEDEFNTNRQSDNKPALPDTKKWWYEVEEPGWVNNELQKYVAGVFDSDTVSSIYDGTLKIIAKKHNNHIISARMNTSESWTYGYFEARLKLPGGKGTWPAFWMMPKDFKNWPDDGEIDIMEYVGYRPNIVQSSIHTKAYNHVARTEKTATKEIKGVETTFHIYALEWTTDYIKGFVDGEEYFRFDNDKQGNKDTWPFDKPFYLKLNLAWGGDWGGSQGIDESKLPATYEIDYVRVYQKK